MSEDLGRGAGAHIRWTVRFEAALRTTQKLIVRGLRPQVVSELTGVQADLCRQLRRELIPDAPAVRASLPSGVEARPLRTQAVYRSGSIFVAAYLAATGADNAARNLDVEAWCVAFDMAQDVCTRLGWEPLAADHAYVIARELTNPEKLVYSWCESCGAPYYNQHSVVKDVCPCCWALEARTAGETSTRASSEPV